MPAPISKEALLEELIRLDEELTTPVSSDDMDDLGEYSASSYSRCFGSWSEAKEEAGLDECDPNRPRHSDEELLQAIRDLAQELKKVPAASDMSEYGEFSHSTYQNRFDSWEDARRQAGFNNPNRYKIPTVILVSELQSLAERIGRSPTMFEMDSIGEYTSEVYRTRFSSWNEALEAAGLEKRPESIPAKPVGPIEDRKYRYGPGWGEQRQKRLEKDEFECQLCGYTEEEHQEEYSRGLEVHHRQRRDDHVDDDGYYHWEQANAIENLITLCTPCHRRWEQISPLIPEAN